jgi:hypothetical protein
MPIEIKELHISVTVNSGSTPKPGAAGTAASHSTPGVDKNALVAECVEQVLKIIHDKVER